MNMENNQPRTDLCKKALINSTYKKSLENNDDAMLECFLDNKSSLFDYSNDNLGSDEKLSANNKNGTLLLKNNRSRRVGQVR